VWAWKVTISHGYEKITYYQIEPATPDSALSWAREEAKRLFGSEKVCAIELVVMEKING
jgi:hypothetical protein